MLNKSLIREWEVEKDVWNGIIERNIKKVGYGEKWTTGKLSYLNLNLIYNLRVI